MQAAIKKRNRKTIVCHNCRQKKNKCDRLSPCSSCVRLGLDSSCKYGEVSEDTMSTTEDEHAEAHTDNDDANSKPKKREKARSLASAGFLFPHVPIASSDPGYKIIRNYWSFRQKDSQFNQFLLDNSTLGLSDAEIARIDAILQEKYAVDFVTYKDLLADSVDPCHLKIVSIQLGRHCGFQYTQCNFTTPYLLEKLKHSLPPINVIWYLADVFFKEVAIFMPVLDEFEYFANLQRIFNIRGSDFVTKITLQHKQDYAIIAQMLLVMRLGWIQVLYSDHELTDFLAHCGFPYKVSVEAITLANECLEAHGFHSQPSIPFLQALILMLEYGTLAPEMGEGILKNHSLRGIILEIAYTLELHREPKCFDFGELDQTTCHLRRKIWFHILKSDTINSCHNINLKRPTVHEFDTKWPSFEIGVTNFKNPSTEKTLSDFTNKCERIILGLNKLLEFSQRLDGDFDANAAMSLLSSVDQILIKSLGCWEHITAMQEGPQKILSFQIFVNTQMFLASFLYMLFLQSDETDSASKLALTRSLIIVYGILSAVTTKVLMVCQFMWGKAAKLVLTPTLGILFNFMTSFSIILSTRVECTILCNMDNRELCQKLDKLSTKLRKFACSRLRMLHLISSDNCFSWKAAKLHLLNLNVALDNSTYLCQSDEVQHGSLKLTVGDVEDIISLLQADDANLQGVDYVHNSDIIASQKLLDTEKDQAGTTMSEDLVRWVETDRLWMTRTILKLYEETHVPDDLEEGNKPGLFRYRDTIFTSIPRYKGVCGLTME